MPRIARMIFVSSTRADLAEYRLAVQQSFPALDVLYRGMEFFGARPNRAHEVIFQELLGCDLYIGILAHRYGSIDPVSGLSFTELEYQTAKQSGIPAIFFLIDPKQPSRHDSIESDESRRKLDRFKEAVSFETVFELFTTPEDLVGKVSRSLEKWLAELEDQWLQLLHVPLNSWENDYIRKLYSTNTAEMTHAVKRLKRVDCRAAHEHFYGMLHRHDLDFQLAESIFDHLMLAHDDVRISQMLLNLIADVPRLRAQAINTIGERATLPERSITDAVIERVIALAGDTEAPVRFAVAHALGKIGTRYPRHYWLCKDCLQILQADLDPDVQQRAKTSIGRLPPRPQAAAR